MRILLKISYFSGKYLIEKIGVEAGIFLTKAMLFYPFTK
jgi:hypothetical protein